MFVRESVVDSVNLRVGSQNILTHLVHGVLHARAVLVCKSVHGDAAGSRPGFIETVGSSLDVLDSLEETPLPVTFNGGAENAIVRLGEDGVRIVDIEAEKRRAGTLQNQEILDARLNGDALALASNDVDDSCVIAVAVEGMRMRLALERHSRPAMNNDIDVSHVDVLICGDEVRRQDRCEEFWRCDGVLLRQDVCGLFLCIGRYNN